MNLAQIWYRRTILKAKKFANKYTARNLIFFIIFYKREKLDSDFGRFLAKHLLRIGLPWQQLKSLVTKKYTKWCVIG